MKWYDIDIDIISKSYFGLVPHGLPHQFLLISIENVHFSNHKWVKVEVSDTFATNKTFNSFWWINFFNYEKNMTVTNFQMSTVDLCHPIYVTYILYLHSNSPRLTFSSLSNSIIPMFFFTPSQEVNLNNYLVLYFMNYKNTIVTRRYQ